MRPKNPRITKLREIRKAKGMTIHECAELLEISERSLASYESGNRAPEFPERIARRLKVPLEDLLDD